MKKLLPIIILVVLLLAAGAGVYLAKHKSSSPSTAQSAASTSQKSTNVFSSIQDALAKSLSLSCDFTTPSGVHVVAHIKNGAVRSDVTGKTPNESGSVLIKDKKMYFWNATMGFMMDMPDMMVTPTGTTGSSSQGQNTINNLEQYKKYCKPAVVDDSLFTLPTNVKFTDESKMMQHMPTGMMPTGTQNSETTTGGGYPIPSKYQQYVPQ